MARPSAAEEQHGIGAFMKSVDTILWGAKDLHQGNRGGDEGRRIRREGQELFVFASRAILRGLTLPLLSTC